MKLEEYNQKIWSFYLRLEADFITSLNYVDFSTDNYTTYSIDFERQLLSICSEVDILCKLLCQKIDSTQSPVKIFEYASILCNYDHFTSTKVHFDRNALDVVPFFDWTTQSSPSWWRAYNAVKHNRIENENYKMGNLENVFMALSALYLLNRYYCKAIATSSLCNEPSPKSQLFSIVGWPVNIALGNGFYHVLDPDGGMDLSHE